MTKKFTPSKEAVAAAGFLGISWATMWLVNDLMLTAVIALSLGMTAAFVDGKRQQR